MKKLYVGSLPWATRDNDLANLFSQFGAVLSATVMIDKMTNRSRGFGFVEMEDDAAADAAVTALNDSDYEGRKLVVNEARPMTDRPDRPSFGGNRDRGGNGGGGYNRDRGGNGGGYNRDRGGRR